MRFPSIFLRCGLIILLWTGMVQHASAQAVSATAIPPAEIRRFDVPDDRPETWPFRQEQWLPMKRDDFEKSLARRLPSSSGPATVVWKQVRYQAVFTGDSLTQGQLHADWVSPQGLASLVSLGKPNLAIEQLSWDNREAVWGTDLKGRHWVFVDRERGQLAGRWACRGRPLLAGVVFDLQLLPATLSQLQLEVPSNFIVRSQAGDTESRTNSANPGFKTWTIFLGDQTECRVLITPASSAQKLSTTVLYEQELSLAVGSDQMLVAPTFQVEVLGQEIDRVTISYPKTVEVSAAYFDERLPLRMDRVSPDGSAEQLTIHLPEPVKGRLRPLRLEGTMRRGNEELSRVPQFQIEEAIWLDGVLNLSLSRPWELRSYRATGYRQSAAPSIRADNETISFQQISPRPQLLLNIDRPAMERVAYVLNQLSGDEENWQLTSEIAVGSRSGTVFAASCRIPDGWRVSSVVQLGGGRESEELPGWEVQTHPESGQLLLMDFSEGLTPGRVNALRIISKRTRSAGTAATGWPAVVPLDCETAEVLLFGATSDLQLLMLPAGDAVERFDPAAASGVWNTLPSWSTVTSATADYLLWHVVNLDSLRKPVSQTSTQIFHVEADVNVNIENEQLFEQINLRLRGLLSGRQLDLQLTPALVGATWRIAEIPEHEPLVPVPAPASDGESSRYSIRLPANCPNSVTLTSDRRQTMQNEYRVPLVAMPTARSFLGRVSITVDRNQIYQLVEAVEAATEEKMPAREAITTEPKRWNYRTINRRWTVLNVATQTPAMAGTLGTLKSVINNGEQGYDYHEWSLLIPQGTSIPADQLILGAPAEVIAVFQGQRLLSLESSTNQISLAGWDAKAGGLLRVRYQTPVQRGLLQNGHLLSVPQSRWISPSFDWTAAIPAGSFVPQFATGVISGRHRSETSWRSRLCGPLSDLNLLASEAPSAVIHRESFGSTQASFEDLAALPGREVIQSTSCYVPDNHTFAIWHTERLRLLNWILLWCALPLGWTLRHRATTACMRFWAVLLSASGCLAVFGPEGWNSLAGGFSSGLLLGGIIPLQRWSFVKPKPRRLPDGSVSTEIFRNAISSATLLVAMVAGIALAMAQEQERLPAAIRPAEPLKGKPDLRVLVPVNRAGRPSEKIQLVYLTPSLFEALNSAEQPPEDLPRQLIAAADCIVSGDESQRFTMRVRYQLVSLQPDPPATLQIPWDFSQHSTLEQCLVDGLPQTVVRTDDSLAIPIEPMPRADAPANGQTIRFWKHDVQLQVRMNAGAESTATHFQTAVFPLLNRHVTWLSSVPLKSAEIAESFGPVTVSLDRRNLDALVGPVAGISLMNRVTSSSIVDDGQTELSMLELLTLRPAVTQVAFRADGRVLSGMISRWEALLPPGGVLRSVGGNKVLQVSQQLAENRQMRVIVEFTEPLKQDFVLEGEYILPVSDAADRFDLLPVQVICGQSAALPQSLVATTSAADYLPELLNLDDPAVIPISIEQFVSRWGDSIPVSRPQSAYQVRDRRQLSFRLLPVPAEPQIISWSEDIAISRQRMDWTLNAEFAPSKTPQLIHSLLLDRRLNLDSVSVEEGGIEQLLRWSKTPLIGSSQNRVTLFLNRPATGASQVRIRGSVRIRPSSQIPLPSVRFEAAKSPQGTLTLSHDSDYRLDFEGRDLGTLLTGSGTVDVAASDAANARVFKISEGDLGLTVRLEPLAGACESESWWHVRPESTHWQIQGRMVIKPIGATREVRLAIPDWLAAQAPVTSVAKMAPHLIEEHGRHFLQWSRADADEELELNWDVQIPVPRDERIQLKLPTAFNSVNAGNWFVLEDAAKWKIADPLAVPVQTLPAEFQSHHFAGLIPETATAVHSTDDVLALERTTSEQPSGPRSVSLVEHQLQVSAEGNWYGRTDFFPAVSTAPWQLVLPAGIEVRGFTPETFVTESNAETGETLLRVTDAGEHRRVSLLWRQSAENPPRGIGSFKLELPRCLQEVQPPTFLRFDTPHLPWRTFSRSTREIRPVQFAIARLEIELAQRNQAAGPRSSSAAEDHQLWQNYRRAAELVAAETAEKTLESDDENRWRTISSLMNEVPDPGPLPKPAAGLSAARISPADRVYQFTDDHSGYWTGWMWRTSWGWTLVGILAFPLVYQFLAMLLSQFRRPWWQANPWSWWLLCGLVWWACFSPPIFGLALIAWSAWEWLHARHAKTATLS